MFVHRKDHMGMYPIHSRSIRDVGTHPKNYLLTKIRRHTQSAHVVGNEVSLPTRLLMNVEQALMKSAYIDKVALLLTSVFEGWTCILESFRGTE